MRKIHGFSLVELSIVLVILGLLVGGVLSGQALIRAAELRSITTDFNRYASAVQAFRDKYFALPGDMTNATSFWGIVGGTGSDATCKSTASTSAATCNGDGDGNIESTTTGSTEILRAWQHLSNAGLIEGTYSGISSDGTHWGVAIGTNTPKSKLTGASFFFVAYSDIAVQAGWYARMFPPAGATHWLDFGSTYTTSVLKNEEAWNIDSKIDDGKPGTGKITTFNNTHNANCASSDTASSANYTLSYTGGNACTLLMGF